MGERYLGIDIGTSGCKALAFDANGRELARAYREYRPLFTDDGGAELDSTLVLNLTLAVLAEAAHEAGGGIGGVGVSSQGEAFTAVAGDGTPLMRAMISSDTRALAIAASWSRDFGTEKLYHITGHTAHPMFSLFKLLWVRENRPDTWRNAQRFLCFEDLLALRLGLDPALGWPLAGRTMLFDVRRHDWSSEILDAAGLRPGQLARPLPSGSVTGHVGGETARRLGLADGCRIVTGGHDQTCGALGAGVTKPGVAMYATGTVECITPAFEQAVFTPQLQAANLCTYDHTVPGMYATVAFSLTGGNILAWFRDTFGQPEVEAEAAGRGSAYERLLESAGEVPSNLLVLPYLTPSGTPYFDPYVGGAILGLRLNTGRGEIIRALLEGVAFEMRLNLEILAHSGCAIHELRLIGGGARSARWNRLKADVLGKPLTTLDITEAGCLGAALLARSAESGETVREVAARWVRPVDRIEPRPEAAEIYARRFETYRRLYPTLKPLAPGSSAGGSRPTFGTAAPA